jgi:drug/metabolite transporter, DME family
MAIQPARATSARLGGSTAILLAATLWGTTGTAQTLVLNQANPLILGAARIVVGGFLLLFLAAARRGAALAGLLFPETRDRRRNRLLLAVAALSVGLYQVSFFAAVATTGVVVGTVVTIGSAPAFAGLLARLSGRRPSRRWLLATAGAATGLVALVSGGEAAGVVPLGVLLALTSGFGYAAYATVAGHLIGRGADDMAVIAAVFGGAGLILLPVLLVATPGWLLTGSGLAVTAYLGAVTTTVGYLLYARGLRTTTVPAATTLTMAEPVVAAVLGLVVVGERLGGTALGGLAVVVASLVLLVRR